MGVSLKGTGGQVQREGKTRERKREINRGGNNDDQNTAAR